jgi:hypothetical protein
VSGNLGRVDFITEYEYDLFIRPDTCNPRYRVWFNFVVDNVRADQRVIFNIVNFSKTKLVYRDGMAPLVKSTSRPKWYAIRGFEPEHPARARHHHPVPARTHGPNSEQGAGRKCSTLSSSAGCDGPPAGAVGVMSRKKSTPTSYSNPYHRERGISTAAQHARPGAVVRCRRKRRSQNM